MVCNTCIKNIASFIKDSTTTIVNTPTVFNNPILGNNSQLFDTINMIIHMFFSLKGQGHEI